MSKSKSKNLGQYYTTDKKLQEIVYKFIQNNPKIILEPSVGQGHLIQYINSQNKDIEFTCYEIDETINPLIPKDSIIFGDFLKQQITKLSYLTIVGNPPYVKTKTGNLYIDFIDKCIDLLDDTGELIMIIPSDFFKLTSAIPTLDKMMKNGYFTDIYHPHNEKLFKNASIDVLIFRYIKTRKLRTRIKVNYKINYNDEKLYVTESGGLITFSKNIKKGYKKLNNLFNIYVGIVNGRENIYKNKLGNITVLNNETSREKYIYITEFPDEDEKINKYLLRHKKDLLNRRIRKFNENNWFEWGALRNISKVEDKFGESCLYVKNLTRDNNICFKGNVEYFGGSLLILIPKMKDLDLDKIMEEINKESYQFKYSGRYKIGQRQLSNLLIKY